MTIDQQLHEARELAKTLRKTIAVKQEALKAAEDLIGALEPHAKPADDGTNGTDGTNAAAAASPAAGKKTR